MATDQWVEESKARFTVGQRVVLRAASPIYKRSYATEILGFDEQGIRIAVPFEDGRLVLIPVGTRVGLEGELGGQKQLIDGRVVDRKGGRERFLVIGPEPDLLRAGSNGDSSGEKVDAQSESSAPAKPVIAVTSGKGGVGKTTFVVNLGIALARLGKRVCLIDGDLGTANVDVVLNLAPRYTLADVIDDNKDMFEVIVEGPEGLMVLPGGSGLQELTQLGPSQFRRLLEQFRALERFTDILLIDTGSGLSRNVTNFVVAASQSILITTPEPPAITDAYALVKVLARQGVDVSLRLVVNRVGSETEADEITQKMVFASRRFLGVELGPLGFVPEDMLVGRSIREQRALLEVYPRSRAAQGVNKVANQLVGELEGRSEAVVEPRGRSFLHRLRGWLPG